MVWKKARWFGLSVVASWLGWASDYAPWSAQVQDQNSSAVQLADVHAEVAAKRPDCLNVSLVMFNIVYI